MICNCVHRESFSITAITDASGNLLESLSYDPWGRRRIATDWTDYNITSTLFDRGFTGHEHLDHFGLINMNGRVYDPFLARFLSPDPYVQAPDYSQNFNRYSYAFNNPLKYTDPDGEWAHLVVGAAIGGFANWLANGAQFNAKGLGYFGVGALAGGLSAGIGAGVGAALAGNAAAGGGFAAGFMGTAAISSTGFVAGAISGAAAGFTNGLVSGTGNQLIEGKKFGDAFVNGGLAQAWRQGLGGAAVGGIMGSIDAILNKEDWLTGSTKKGYAFTDGDNVFSESGLLNDKGIKLNDSYAPQKVEIKAPGGRYTKYDIPSAEGGYTLLNKGNIAHEFYFEITDNNSIIFEFFNGSPGGGLLAAKVSYPIRVQSNNIFKHQLFFGTHRRYSGFLMFLNY